MIEFEEDGAHEGIGAAYALLQLMGEPIPEWYESAPAELMGAVVEGYSLDGWPEHDGSKAAYDTVARICAAVVLRLFRTDPKMAEWPPEDLWKVAVVERPWLDDALLAPTLFQWGWGVNCARRLCELPPVSNPALMESENAKAIVIDRMYE